MEKQTNRSSASLSTVLVGVNIQWLYALPNAPDTVDLFAINEDNFAIRLIGELLSGKHFSLPINAGFLSSEQLNHFNWEAKNRERVLGQKTFGFGYPMLFSNLQKDGSLPVVAPLFFWQLGIEADALRNDFWSVQRTENQYITPNFPLFKLLNEAAGIDLFDEAKSLATGRKLEGNSLALFCQKLNELLGTRDVGLPLGIGHFPQADEVPDLISGGSLHWSGIIGILPAISKSAATMTPNEADLPVNYTGGEKSGHGFGMLAVDPSQRAAMIAARAWPISVVEGASGTGKTQTLANMVINALSNGQKCLVVSQSVSALKRTQNFLLQGKFGDLSFILRDSQTDLPVLLDILRASAENARREKAWDADAWKLILTQTLRAQSRLDETFQALNTPVFEGLGWSEIVGRFLRANRQEGKELLMSQLSPADFDFSEKEYRETVVAIGKAEELLAKSGNLKHPLSPLKNDVFLEKSPEKGLEYSKQWLALMLDKARDLHHRFLVKSNEYAEALTEHYENHFLELAALSGKIRDGVEDGVNRFGPDFEKPASVTEKLYGVFSDRYREMLGQKEKIAAGYDDLKKAHSTRRYFDFDFPARFESSNIKKVRDLGGDFEASLRLWRKRSPALVRDEVRRLSAKTTLFDLDFRGQMEELEYAQDLFVEEFNQSAVFEEKISHQMLTLPKRQEFLETVIDRLETTRDGLKDWGDFHIWQSFWLRLSIGQRKAIAALIKIKPRNWAAAWESWFLHHLLQHEYTSNLVWDQAAVDQLTAGRERLFDLLPGQIGSLWQNRKAKTLRKLKDDSPDDWKIWFGKHNRETDRNRSLDELFRTHFEAMTETLPVLLVTPSVALDVVQANEQAFDMVFIDEAHNIPVQEGLPLLKMGKKTVVFGDSKQDMTPMEQDDLLEFCKKRQVHSTTLDYQHQDSPEEWIRFNRIAFGTPFKRLPRGNSAFEATVCEFVGGRYDSKTRTNQAEAEQIIHWLNDIKPTPANTYPVVGIACATIEQRNLISSNLLKIRQKRAAGYEKIHSLLLNGLTVSQFGELQGQHVDILLVSFTHGPVDATNRLTDDLHFWNTEVGLNQLHVLMTRATQKMYLAHSLLPGLLPSLATNPSAKGISILSHLVRFADYLQKIDPVGAEKQLAEMAQLLDYQPDVAPPSLFLEEMEIALNPYFEAGRIRRNTDIVGVGVPLLIKGVTDRSPDSVLIVDGLIGRSGAPAFLFERKKRNFLAKFDIELVTTWSVNWWKNPRQEARKLASRIIRQEQPISQPADEMPISD